MADTTAAATENPGAGSTRPVKAILVAVFSMSLALAISLVIVFLVKNIHRPKFHGEFQAAHLFSWQRQRSGFIYTCTSEHCLKEGEQLQKHIAWTLDPCDDFYDYVCSSTKPASSVRKSAVKHFLREIHDVIRKFSKLGWLKRTSLTSQVTSFYRACKAGPHNAAPDETRRVMALLKLGGKDSYVEDSLAMLAKGSVLDSATQIPMTTVNSIEDEIMSISPSYFSVMDNVEDYYSAIAFETDPKDIVVSYVKMKVALSTNYLKRILKSGEVIYDTNLELTSHFDPDTNVLGVPLSIAPLMLKGREFFLESSTVGFVMTRFLYYVFQEKFMFSSDSEAENLQYMKSCLEHQYSTIEVPALNKTLDGQRTLRENMADNVAVAVLHRAYKTSLLFYISTMDALGFQNVFLHFENLPSVSSEQLFYLMFGQSFCDPEEDTARVVDDAMWSPAKYRVNVPLSNYQPFAKAFECKLGSRMNPKKRCPPL
ncbi:hypothetical protein IscW_ISCW020857 [Ixodes scapularis]|uniref:Peptidase M13 C-terminal domain-containing protein n=1 Tax=Ixodes scapularis TaxID=6945 RepID=B7Q0I3_IXOSC|nr:hypothetical protein IscW_ISCW020857 [Ixodes scapularis]|eukprot:XP_002407735.1 hypothetical protein IscW_ISCW020857 [Ixodes scapularis]